MKLMEYQSRQLLAEVGVPLPEGLVVDTPQETADAQARLGGTVAIKAQVLAGGRGKAGGVRIARTPEEAASSAEKILRLEIGGQKVRRLLVVRAVRGVRELYLSLLVDRKARGIEAVFSDKGGIAIEDLAAGGSDRIRSLRIDPFRGPEEASFISGIESDTLDRGAARGVFGIASALFRLLVEKDCLLAELNPLSMLEDGKLVALDAKVVVDDNGLGKHPELLAFRNAEEYVDLEVEAREAGLSYVGLDGDIGCMVNGAGLSMATMDLIKHYGSSPANFLDIGGSSNPDKVVKAFSLLLAHPGVKAILVNIFGGITRCDDVANGIVRAKSMIDIRVPTVIRLIGTNDVPARKILLDAEIEAYDDLGEAIRRVVAYAS
jgi:succinyl-CoA synthetase beta subunit